MFLEMQEKIHQGPTFYTIEGCNDYQMCLETI